VLLLHRYVIRMNLLATARRADELLAQVRAEGNGHGQR
jgi:hypothetical protein